MNDCATCKRGGVPECESTCCQGCVQNGSFTRWEPRKPDAVYALGEWRPMPVALDYARMPDIGLRPMQTGFSGTGLVITDK